MKKNSLFKQIYEGWRNNLFPPEQMKEVIETVYKERMAICNECPFHSKFHKTGVRLDDHCTDCGCVLVAKTKCLSCSCPQGKWTEHTESREEDLQINKEVYGE